MASLWDTLPDDLQFVIIAMKKELEYKDEIKNWHMYIPKEHFKDKPEPYIYVNEDDDDFDKYKLWNYEDGYDIWTKHGIWLAIKAMQLKYFEGPDEYYINEFRVENDITSYNEKHKIFSIEDFE